MLSRLCQVANPVQKIKQQCRHNVTIVTSESKAQLVFSCSTSRPGHAGCGKIVRLGRLQTLQQPANADKQCSYVLSQARSMLDPCLESVNWADVVGKGLFKPKAADRRSTCSSQSNPVYSFQNCTISPIVSLLAVGIACCGNRAGTQCMRGCLGRRRPATKLWTRLS